MVSQLGQTPEYRNSDNNVWRDRATDKGILTLGEKVSQESGGPWTEQYQDKRNTVPLS